MRASILTPSFNIHQRMLTTIMSKEVQLPSPRAQSSSHLHKDKDSKSPPVAFNTRSARQGHIRSSSFSGFVSRLLPSRRQEKGHTLRSEFNDDGTHDPVGLVFSLSIPKSQGSLPGSESIDEALARRTRSWSPRKNSGPSNEARTSGALNNDRTSGIYNELEWAGGFADGDVARFSRRAGRTGRDGIPIKSTGADKRKFNNLWRMFGSIKRARGEIRSERKYSESSLPQPPEILEHNEPRLEAFSDEKVVTKPQQMFDDKRSRREQRRSLREGGDFLGVQGANPRTGYWDISDATSSSEPSQMSENTKLKLDQQARELAEQKRKYDEALELHQKELERVQTLKDSKKKVKGEQKKMELKLRQRRYGKWKLSENGWSSVAEPELSPIQQSVTGTPVAELAPGDRLFPMPSAAEPTPYVNMLIKQDDYFGRRVVSSPLARQTPDQAMDASLLNSRKITIPRKPVGSPGHQRKEESLDTIVHYGSSINPVLIQPSSPHPAQQPKVGSFPDPALARVGRDLPRKPSDQQHPFLGKEALSSEPADPYGKKAIVISFRSASMRQVALRPPLAQSLSAQRIISLNELPPVSLKDPIAARIPSSYQTPKVPLQTWAPPTIVKTEPDRPAPSINTSTIITIGCAPLQRLLGQLDGPNDIRNDTPSTDQRLQHKSSQVPLRTSSHQRSGQRERHSTLSQTHPVNTVISSEHHLNLTKQRSIRLCQMSSPEADRTALKSTPISISMSPPGPEKQKEAAQNAALLAYQQLRHQMALKKTEGQIGGQPTPPKRRNQKREAPRDTNARGVDKIAWGENGGTGDLSPSKPGTLPKASRASPVGAVRLATSRAGASDKLAVWHPEPSAEKNAGGRETGAHTKAAVVLPKPVSYQKGGVSRPRGVPRPGRRTQSMGQVVVGMARRAWLVVEPVFDPDSGIRRRLDRQRLTWQDVGLFVAAAMFAVGTLLAAVVLARVVAVGLQAMRAVGAVFRLLTGF